MKKRISATIDSQTEKFLEDIMAAGRYRNKSHSIEEVIRIFCEEKLKKIKEVKPKL